MNSSFRIIPFYPIGKLLLICIQNGGVEVKKIPIFFLFLFRYFIFEPFRLAQIIFYDRKIMNHQMHEDPIFILGHWRSGTTYLQELLSCNVNHTTTSVYQFLFIDHFLITEKWLVSPFNFVCRILKIPYSFQRVQMDLNMPGEMESAMCSGLSKYSYTWGHIFPKRYWFWFEKMIELEDMNDINGWLDDYDYLIRKISYSSGGKRVVVKSPGDTGRAKYLMKKYPNAKFIFINREPISVYHSTMYFWNIIQKEVSFQHVNNNQLHQFCINSYVHLLNNYNSFREEIPSNQLFELNFQDLISDPIFVLKSLYSHLDMGEFPEERIKKKIGTKRPNSKGLFYTSLELAHEIHEKWEKPFTRI
jgi:hypothetical protein